MEKHERQRHREKDPARLPGPLIAFQILAPTPCEVHLEFLCLDPEKRPSDLTIHSVEAPSVVSGGSEVADPHQNPRVATNMPTPFLIKLGWLTSINSTQVRALRRAVCRDDEECFDDRGN